MEALKHDDVARLIDILQDNGKPQQSQEFAHLAGYIDTLHDQLNTVLGELKEVKQRLDAISDKKNPVVVAYIKVADKLENTLTVLKTQLYEARNHLIFYAKQTVADFEIKGLSALNRTVEFLKIKNILLTVKNTLEQTVKGANQSISKIEVMDKELRAAGTHVKNVGRVLVGKDNKTVNDTISKDSKVVKILQKPFEGIFHGLNGLGSEIDKALDRLDWLAQKSSVKGKVEQIKSNIGKQDISVPVQEISFRR